MAHVVVGPCITKKLSQIIIIIILKWQPLLHYTKLSQITIAKFLLDIYQSKHLFKNTVEPPIVDPLNC